MHAVQLLHLKACPLVQGAQVHPYGHITTTGLETTAATPFQMAFAKMTGKNNAAL